VPLRVGTSSDVLRLGGLEWARRSPGARRRRRWIRGLRRLAGTVIALAVLGGIVFTGLLLICPPVANAPALTRALDRAHHAAYPGPQPPRQFTAALLLIEGRQFYSQASAGPIAVARVLFGHLTGGSGPAMATLYQQLAKILYLHGRSGTVAASEQALLAIKLELSYSRAAVLRMYADVIYFGRGYYGLSAASCGYFGQRPERLSWGQAAMLAALAWAPTVDDPFSQFANARAGEASVLGLLAANRTLTRAQAAAAYRQPLRLARRPLHLARRPLHLARRPLRPAGRPDAGPAAYCRNQQR